MKNKTIFNLLVGTALMASPNLYAKQVHKIGSGSENIIIDGVMNEAAWQSATKVELAFEINPSQNTTAPVKTTAYIYESDEVLNVAFVAIDPEPEKIRAYYRDRDTIFQDDFVGIVIDTFNDDRRAYEFFVNPFGVQGDLIKDDSQGGNEDSSWDAIWHSAGTITDEGYIVELAIPFKALRFPENNNNMTWGFQALRIYPRDSRMVLANSAMEPGRGCDICQYDEIEGISGKSDGNNIQITPTLTYSREEYKPNIPGEWHDPEDNTEVGVSFRWGINDNLYLNATLNPDFSQVEADAAQLDINNTFSLFVREKRPFFLDGKDYFSTQRMNLVHTRNINAPEYGVKLTGKNGKHTYGTIVANDTGTSFVMPGSLGSSVAFLDERSRALIGRYRMDIGERNNVGIMVTDRRGGDYRNTVTTVDGRQQIGKSGTFSYQVAHSSSANPEELQSNYGVASNYSDTAYSLSYRQGNRDYGVRGSYDNYGKDFRADLGFVGRTGYERAVVGGDYNWYFEDSKWNHFGVFGDWDKTYDSDGTMLEEEYEIHGVVNGPMQFHSKIGVVTRERFWSDNLYREDTFMTFARFDPLDNLRVWVFNSFGDQIDFANNQLGEGNTLELGSNFKIGRHVNGEIRYLNQKLDVSGGELYDADQIEARVHYQFNLKSSVRLIVQHTDIDRNSDLYDGGAQSTYKSLSTELLYSYKINPQSLFYLGYTDNGFQNDNLSKIEKNQRKVFMKFSYAYQM